MNNSISIDSWLTQARGDFLQESTQLFNKIRSMDDVLSGFIGAEYKDSTHVLNGYTNHFYSKGWNPPYKPATDDKNIPPLLKKTCSMVEQKFEAFYKPITLLCNRFCDVANTAAQQHLIYRVTLDDKKNDKAWAKYNFSYITKMNDIFKLLTDDQKSDIDIFDYAQNNTVMKINMDRVLNGIIKACEKNGIYAEHIKINNSLYFINDFLLEYNGSNITNGPTISRKFTRLLKTEARAALAGAVMNKIPNELFKRFLDIINIKEDLDHPISSYKNIGLLFNSLTDKDKWPDAIAAIRKIFPGFNDDKYFQDYFYLDQLLNQLPANDWEIFNALTTSHNFLFTFAQHTPQMVVKLIKEGGYNPHQVDAKGVSVLDHLITSYKELDPLFFIPDDKWFSRDKKDAKSDKESPGILNLVKMPNKRMITKLLCQIINAINVENVKDYLNAISDTINDRLYRSLVLSDIFFEIPVHIQDPNKWNILFEHYKITRKKPFELNKEYLDYLFEKLDSIGVGKLKTINTIIPETPFTHIAAENDCKERIQCFLRVGVDINTLNGKKQTMLHIAAAKRNTTLANELLSKPLVNFDIPDSNNKTAFEILFENKMSLDTILKPFISDIKNEDKSTYCNWQRVPKNGKGLFYFIAALIDGLSVECLDALISKLSPEFKQSIENDFLEGLQLHTSVTKKTNLNEFYCRIVQQHIAPLSVPTGDSKITPPTATSAGTPETHKKIAMLSRILDYLDEKEGMTFFNSHAKPFFLTLDETAINTCIALIFNKNKQLLYSNHFAALKQPSVAVAKLETLQQLPAMLVKPDQNNPSAAIAKSTTHKNHILFPDISSTLYTAAAHNDSTTVRRALANHENINVDAAFGIAVKECNLYIVNILLPKVSSSALIHAEMTLRIESLVHSLIKPELEKRMKTSDQIPETKFSPGCSIQ